jgi:hypothetical protein
MAIIEIDPTAPPVPTHEQTLSEVDENEAESFVRAPTINPQDYAKKPDWFKLAGQGFMDSLVQQAFDTPATTFVLAGRLEKEKKIEKYGPDPFLIAEVDGQRFMYDPAKETTMEKVGEKWRNVGIALRKWAALDDANRAKPAGFGEEMVEGLGSGVGSMLGLILGTMAGTAAGTAVSPGPGSVAGAIGGYSAGIVMDALNEKSMMAKQLMDAGYSPRAVENVSNFYGSAIGVIDYASFGMLGKLVRPALSRAVKGTLARRIAGITAKAAEGFLTEGGTEAVQQRIQTETEIAFKLKDRDLERDLIDDALAFVVGGLIGGTAGTAGQLQLRRDKIAQISEKTGLRHDVVAAAVDEAFLRANESVYDVLIEHYDISQDVAWIDRAFKKVDGKTELGPVPSRVDETMPDEYQGYETLMEAVQTDEAAKSFPRRIGKVREDIRTLEGLRQGLVDEDARIAQAKLDELGAELEMLKKENTEYLEKNPKLMALLSEGDALMEEHKTADPARKLEIEQKIDDINFAVQNPGSVQAAVKAAESKVEGLQSKAREQYQKLTAMENDPMSTESSKTLTAELTATVEALLRAERQLGGMETIAARLKGEVALTSGQVRIAMRQQLRQILDGYTMGRKFSQQDLRAIQKAFRVLLKGSNLSRRAAMSMLRSVLTIRTPEQFNEKIGVIVGHINSLIRAEKVGEYQKIGWKMLEKMKTSEGKVTPEAQVLAEHLRRVFRGQVPQVEEGGTGNVNDLVNQQVEQAVYDLANSEDDAGAARRSLEILRNYYENKLQKFQDFKKAQKDTYQRLAKVLEGAVLEDGAFDDLKAAFDATRQKDKRKNRFLMTPYDTSIMTILNMLDNASGAKNMEGPLVTEFSSDRPYQAMIVLRHQAKEWVDGKMVEIYGKNALDLWMNTRTKDFADVLFAREGKPAETVNISRAEAMSLYLMTKMPGIYNELLRMGVDEAWLQSFKNGDNVKFSKEDHAYMEAQREALDWMADKIAPVYERLTGKPFRRVDNYFMTYRYMARSLEEGGVADTTSVIDEMLSGDFDNLDPTDVDSLKRRTKSKALFAVPDIFEAMSFYMNDMVHFVSYADYVVKFQQVFQNQRMKKVLADRLPKGMSAIFDEYVQTLSGGSISRSSDRRAMGWMFKLLGQYARNQVSTPKNFVRQLTGVAAGMDLEGGGPVEFLAALADLPRAIKSGELKQLTETSYMKERFAGLYEMAVLYVQEQSQAGKGKGGVSKQLHDVFTSFPRYGDRFASIGVGWMIYRDRMKKGMGQTEAIQEAIRAIDQTQQSMDQGKTPLAFNRADLPSRLLTIFARTPAIYLDRYLNTWKAFRAGRITKAQWLRSMVMYHVTIPLFEVAVTAGDWEPWETALAMFAGPYAYHLIIGQTIRSIVAGAMEGLSDGEAELPFYLKDASNTTLIGSMARDVLKLGREIAKAFDTWPDYETMWGAWKALGKVGDFGPVPTGWLSRTPEGIYEMLQGDPESIINGAKTVAGWPESRTKNEDED